MGKLDGTVALVTGASSGIGEATARALAAEGAAVAIVARRADRLDRLGAEIAEAGGTALPIEADVSEREQAEGAVAGAAEQLGRLDVVVNNAGVMLLGPIENAPVEEWERMIDVNVNGLLYTSRAAVPYLLKAAEDGPRGVADLVNISSVAGRTARPGNGVYAATKWGMNGWAESLRQELLPGIRVTLIEPGVVATDLPTHITHPQTKEDVQKLYDQAQVTADDIAETITFVLSRPRRLAINEVLLRPAGQQ